MFQNVHSALSIGCVGGPGGNVARAVNVQVRVRYTKHCVDGQPSGHSFVADTRVVLFSRSTVETMPRPIITVCGTMLLDVLLIYIILCISDI